jgi:23S rRNA pseudouridine1911/1915/1917 synthase
VIVGPEQRKERIDKVLPSLLNALLNEKLGGVSRATVQRWIEDGRVLVNGAPCRPKDEVRAGAVIEVSPGASVPSAAEPDATVSFTVLHEDESLIVVDKPAGVVVHPARGHWTGTLVSGLLARPGFERAPSDERDPMGPLRPGIVHRIDKDTSGVLVVAKTESAREALKAQLAAHSMERTYRGITLGVPREGVIRTHYGRSPASRVRFTSLLDQGKKAVTHVAVEERLAGGRAALVRCRLETGRTHQIRVHLAERAKTPLLADALYGRKSADPGIAPVERALGRQALHAQELGFVHPASGERMHFEAKLPADLELALASLRALDQEETAGASGSTPRRRG